MIQMSSLCETCGGKKLGILPRLFPHICARSKNEEKPLSAPLPEFGELPRNLVFFFRPHKLSRDLLVLVGHSPRFALFKQAFDVNVLFISEKKPTYYTYRADKVATAIAGLIQRLKFRRVIFAGASKGGFGSLLYTSLVAHQAPEVFFGLLAFSPQTQLYPHNPTLPYPSYKGLIRGAKEKPRLMRQLRKFGNLSRFPLPSNVTGYLIYGSKNSTDSAEAQRLSNGLLTPMPIPYAFHNTLLKFAVDWKDPEARKKEVELIYQKAEKDEELRQSLPENPEELDAALANFDCPSLHDLIETTFKDISARMPARSFWARASGFFR